MPQTVRDVILGRWKPSFDQAPRLKPVRAALEAALNAQDAVRTRQDALAKDAKLSPLGRLDDVRGFVSRSTAPVIHRARATAKSAREEVAAWKQRLHPPRPDPKDMAAAILRSEMRTMLRGMKLSERLAHVYADGADPTLVQAVLEAPNFASGITDDIRGRLLDLIVNRDHPDQLAAIAETEEALELLEAATDVARNAARSVAEFPTDHLFEAFIGETAAPPTKPVMSADPDAPLSESMRASNEFHERLMAEARAELAAL